MKSTQIFIGQTDAEAEATILWLPNSNNWLTGKDANTGKDWRQEEKGRQRMRWLDDITDSMEVNLSKFREMVKNRKPGVLQSMGSQRVRHNFSNWTRSPKYKYSRAPFVTHCSNKLTLSGNWGDYLCLLIGFIQRKNKLLISLWQKEFCKWEQGVQKLGPSLPQTLGDWGNITSHVYISKKWLSDFWERQFWIIKLIKCQNDLQSFQGEEQVFKTYRFSKVNKLRKKERREIFFICNRRN